MRLQNLAAVIVSLCALTHISNATPIYHVQIAHHTLETPDRVISPTTANNRLLKRGEWIANLGNGWAAYYETWESFLPAQLAASVLTSFYSSILDQAQSSTASLSDPGLFQAFEWDNIRLEFSSDARRISWEFIATFVARMAARTQRGFTGQFNAVYVHMATEQSIRISLMVLRNAART